jgi:hypothetical protein
MEKHTLLPLTISLAVALIFIADRTGFWLKEQRQFDAWTFASLGLLSLLIGFLTVQREEADMGFLNRDQTDEWKGWMQGLHFTCPRCYFFKLTCFRFGSCDSSIPLLWRFSNFWNLQSHTSPSGLISLHDWLWPYDVLYSKGRLWVSTCCTGMLWFICIILIF